MLFTLGDKPELRYKVAREELAALGHETTISYLAEVAGIVAEETGLLPHANPGVMTAEDIALLRKVSVSQGIMLESVSSRLMGKGRSTTARRIRTPPPALRPSGSPESSRCPSPRES